MKAYALAAAGAALLGLYYLNRKTTAPGQAVSPGALPVAIGGIMDKLTGAPPKGIRNNNPLNIEYNARNQWDGQTGTDGRFATFSDAFYGIRAAAKLLKNYGKLYQANTVRSIISRWAPANGKAPDGTRYKNDVEAYVSSVEKRSGLFRDMHLSETDYPALIAAMIHHENGQQPYSMALITDATQAGFL